MRGLPPEISSTVVAHLDRAKPDDRKALHSLLLVSKQTNPIALRRIYKDISFTKQFCNDHLSVLRSLSSHAARNPGLQFTAEFSFQLQHGYGLKRHPYDEINLLLALVVSCLVNVRCLRICMESGHIGSRIIQSLQSCAHLTHLELEECSMRSDDFRQFVLSHTTLEWLNIDSQETPQSFEQRVPLVNVPLATSLPHLISLSITTEDMEFFRNPLTSLINLDLIDAESACMRPTREASILRQMAPFAAITSCHLTTFYLINILPIMPSLPHLEYLWVHELWLEEESSKYDALSGTQVKYLRCYVHSESGWDWESNTTMQGLPPEITSTIFAELHRDKPDDNREALHSLLLVSKHMNQFALRAIYEEITPATRICDDALDMLRSLSRYAANNPGLRLTAAFSFTLKRGYAGVKIPYGEINHLLGRIFPFLANVRRVAISFQEGLVDVRFLRSIPSRAPLTHLKVEQCSLGSDDLRHLLAARPALEWVHIYSPGKPQPCKQVSLPAGALPRLAFLSIPAKDTVFFEHPLPSLTNLDLDALYMSQIHEPSIVHLLTPYAAVTSCHLSNIYTINIAPFLASLPRLEYLWIGRTTLVVRPPVYPPLVSMLTHNMFWRRSQDDRLHCSVFSGIRLRYLRCCVYSEAAVAFGRRMFDCVETLVVVDVTSEPLQSTIRLCQGRYQGPVFYKSGAWTRWWEDAKGIVEIIEEELDFSQGDIDVASTEHSTIRNFDGNGTFPDVYFDSFAI
ncbi:hypothetical protein EYR38_009192 [Pleurotus pulmonarius]|nr:hypothetical protein EYR38_009192 [Pleurotus pulmonarius]